MKSHTRSAALSRSAEALTAQDRSLWTLLPAHGQRLVAVLSILIAASLLYRYQLFPSHSSGADAWGYQFHAFRFRQYGVLSDIGSIRTYGYPLFLYALSFASGFDEARLAAVAGATQYVLFLGAATWLARLTKATSTTLALALLAGLLLNPWILALVTDTLTEGLSIPLFVFLICVAWKAQSGGERAVAWLGLGSSIAAVAVMIRPANLLMVVAWALVLCVAVCRARNKTRMLSAVLALSLLAFGAAWAPQIFYNVRQYGAWSALPVCDLRTLQVTYGIGAWKYDTLITTTAASPWFYANPLLKAPLARGVGLIWYFREPGAGAATLLAHLFNTFSVTSLFTYVWDQRPLYGLVLRTVYWLLALVGLSFGLNRLWALRSDRRHLLPLIFVSATTAGVIASASITAVETRFGAAAIAVISVTGLLGLVAMRRGAFLSGWRSRSALALALVGCVVASYGMDRLGRSQVSPFVTAVDLTATRCYLLGHGEPDAYADGVRRYGEFMRKKNQGR